MPIVETLTDLERVLEPRSRHGGRVALRLDFLDAGDRDSWEHRLNRHYRACGCETGAVTMLIATVGIAGFAATNHGAVLDRPVYWGGLGLVVLCAALVSGKAYGLWLSRRKLKATVEAIRRIGAAQARQTSRVAAGVAEAPHGG